MFARFAGSSSTSLRQASSAELVAFCFYLNPNYTHPSRRTLVKNIFDEAEHAMKLIKKLLDSSPIVSILLLFKF